MRKIKLDLDALQVDSFETSPPDEGEGTVHGNQFQITPTRVAISCLVACTQLTCGPTCRATCFVSCFQTCQLTCFQTCHFSCDATCVTCGRSCFPTCGALCDPPF
ncbi:MAG TPA: pinensin family lanthipeptide [Longimicrobium sp.]|nr:pinensin family lanthipeptide [Longimicrobium sp.]